jgi:hypothetical protein
VAYVVVSGLPGSGKPTVAGPLAERLDVLPTGPTLSLDTGLRVLIEDVAAWVAALPAWSTAPVEC